MKKIYFTLLSIAIMASLKAASYTITPSGTTWSPATLTVNIGDEITIQGSSLHPAVEVDQSTWTANGTTSLSTGWGVKTADYTFTITTNNTIYFVCQVHASMGMKGQIIVAGTGVNEITTAVQSLNVFPNPAQSQLNVKFNLTESSVLNADLVNINGQHIMTLINDLNLAAGDYNYSFEIPYIIPSGTYFLEVKTENKKSTQTIAINK